MKRLIKNLYLLLILAFLYAPIAVLIAMSFNESKFRGHWTHFTFDWYVSLFEREDILEAFANTMSIGFLAALFATLIAIVTSVAVVNVSRKKRLVVTALSNVSMLNADIVTGVSLMLLFLGMGIRFGYGSVLLAHTIFCVPYALLNILPMLLGMDMALYESALDLGAKPVQAFFHVVLPEIVPGIVSGFLMAFTMSADDFIITHFTKGVGVDTLPTAIYAELKLGIHPEMYALTTLMTGALLLLLFLLHLNRRALARRGVKPGAVNLIH